MERFRLPFGIFIDDQCNGIKRLHSGIFLPILEDNGGRQTAIEADIQILIDKWWPKTKWVNGKIIRVSSLQDPQHEPNQ